MSASPQPIAVEERRTPSRSRGLSRMQPSPPSPDLEAQSKRAAVSVSPLHAAEPHHLRGTAPAQKFVKKCKVFMYNFGSPRVGNGNFAQFYNRIVPCSYRYRRKHYLHTHSHSRYIKNANR